MTVTIYSNAAITAAYGSTRYTATVNGNTAPVLQCTGTAEYAVPGFWTLAATVEVGRLRIAADEAVTVVISPYDLNLDPITSAILFPSGTGATVTVSGGVATVELPAGVKVRLETNGERGQPVFIQSLAPLTVPSGGTVDIYNGTQVAALAGRTLVFPAGITNLVSSGVWNDILFPVEAGASVFIRGDAHVIGNFDCRTDNWDIDGHGTLSGEFTDNATVSALPTFAEQVAYSMIYGNTNDGVFRSGTSLSNIAIVSQPYYGVTDGPNVIDGILLIAPFNDNTAGVSAIGDRLDDYLYSVTDVDVWSGDDALIIDHWRGVGTVTNCRITTSGSACFMHGYIVSSWQVEQPTYSVTITDCYVRAVCDYYFIDPNEGGAVVQGWTDGLATDLRLGIFNVTYNNLTVESDSNGINCMLFFIGNRAYTWGDVQDQVGQSSGWRFNGVTVSHVPAQPSSIIGLDSTSTPFDFNFEDLVIADQIISVRNYSDYFDINAYPYDIRFGGRPLVSAVDVCNMALGLIGNKAKVTAISPVDGSAESTHCARYYPIALRSLLEMHNWSFAQRKIELTVVNADPDDTDDPAWCYRYQIPDDWVKTISILADEAEDNYLIAGVKQPQDCEIKYSETDEEQRLYTDTEDAWLRYTFYEDDPNQWSQLFIQALAWHLAAMLAGPIIKGAEGHTEAQRCLQRMGQYLAEAKGKDSNERQATLTRKASWIAGR